MVLALAGLAAWWWMRGAGPRWARDVALPEIARLVEEEDDYHAFLLARQAQPHLPGNAALQRFFIDHTFPLTVETNPPGATVLMKPYREVDAPWEPLGRTPLKRVARSLANLRLRIEKDGFEPVEVAVGSQRGVCASAASRWTRRTRPRRGWSGSRGGSRIPGPAARRAPRLLARPVRGHEPAVQGVRRPGRIPQPGALEGAFRQGRPDPRLGGGHGPLPRFDRAAGSRHLGGWGRTPTGRPIIRWAA